MKIEKIKNRFFTIIDTDNFTAEFVHKPYSVALGITIGPTMFVNGKVSNICIYIDVLFGSFELEFRWTPTQEKTIAA